MLYQLKLIDLNQNLPPADSFLSLREQAFFQTLRFPKRRTEWLGGRFALKTLIAETFSLASLNLVEILPQETGKPKLVVNGKESNLAFSISHSNGYALVAISTSCKCIGIDLEKIEHRIGAWADNFFHPTELIQKDDIFLTKLWTQKEALVKLLGVGLSVGSFDVRCVEGKPQFFGRALDIYKELGICNVLVDSKLDLIDGFVCSIACGQ